LGTKERISMSTNNRSTNIAGHLIDTRILRLFLCAVIGFTTSALTPAHSAVTSAASPEDVVRAFYGWYLKAGLPLPKRSNLATFRKYNTQSFLKRATAPDVDSVLFIDAQDLDETWANNFSVSPATIQGKTATTEVTLTGQKVHYKLDVTLRQENGVWKINGVKGKDWKDVS